MSQLAERERVFLQCLPGLEPVGSSPAEFTKYIRAESTTLGKVIRDSKIKAEYDLITPTSTPPRFRGAHRCSRDSSGAAPDR